MSNSILRQRSGDRFDPGYIYVVQMVGHPVYKIGRSSNVPRRMSEIGVQLPFPYRLVFAHKVPYVHFQETDFHRDLAAYHKNGEWFELSDACVEVIQARLLYAQAEWLTYRILERLNADDLYPDVLLRYGRVLLKLGERNTRRLTALVVKEQKGAGECLVTDVLSAEIVG